MLVQLLDAQGEPHFVAWQGQDQINDYSSSLGALAVGPGAALQLAAIANLNRAGFLFQNVSANPMLFLEEGALATSAWYIPSGGIFPPYPGYPIPTGILQVIGTPASVVGDAFILRDWQNAAGE